METETLELYSDNRHYETLCNWMNRHDLGSPEKEMLSDFGLVINDTAMGFLFKTNSKTCYVDNIVTNPSKSSDERNDALNLLIKNIEFFARKSGFKLVTILTNTGNMDKRVFAMGYRSYGAYSLFYKKLGEV